MAVTTANETTSVVIAVGANLGPREETINLAAREIKTTIGELLSLSQLLESKAVVPASCSAPSQPNYLNGVILVETSLTAEAVLIELLAIEKRLGRTRLNDEKNLPRTIDLDLIAYGDKIISSPSLQIPHPRMHERYFVLKPMSEVVPDWRHPQFGLTVKEMLAKLPRDK